MSRLKKKPGAVGDSSLSPKSPSTTAPTLAKRPHHFSGGPDKTFNATITGVSRYLPEGRLTNLDLEKVTDTSDEWIKARTGISERRILDDGLPTSYMAVKAAQSLLDSTGTSPDEIGLIIVGTVTPDMMFPSTACVIQNKIGAKNAWGFDLLGACCGFIYSLMVGAQFVETGAERKVMVVGADKMSSIVDYNDRATCVLFGDGAGAVLLEPTNDPEVGILDFSFYIDGSGGEFLYMPGGGSLHPPTHETIDRNMHRVHQDGRVLFRAAVEGMIEVSLDVLNRNSLTGKDIDLFVPHQANKRIIDASVKRIGLDDSKIIINIDKYANTTCGTIPICLSETVEEGRLKAGNLILLTSFGAGYTAGSVLLRWTY